MPFSKSYQKRRSNRTYHGKSKVSSSNKALSARQIREVKRIALNQAEKKAYVGAGSTNATLSGIFTQIAPVSQGDLISQREGNTIRPASLTFNYIPYSASETAGVDEKYNTIRTILLVWHPDSADDAPTLADIFADSTYPMISPYQVKENKNKFTILHDSVQTLNQNYLDVEKAGDVVKVFVDGSKMRKQQYSGGATSGTNMIYKLSVSDSALPNHPSITWAYNFRFYDM